jgi:hypothetical protein
MAYIGKQPVIGNFQKCDSIAVVNGQAAYTLQVGGTNVSPQSENHMLVSLNGILQAPVDSFTVSGSTLTFASNLVTGDVIDFVMILGNVLDLGVPSDNTVSLAKLTATGTKDATTFLRGDNTFAEAGGGITSASQFRLTADLSLGGGTNQDITANIEEVDTNYSGIGTAMTESSGIFSFPSTGIWLITFIGNGSQPSPDDGDCYIKFTTDNSTYNARVVNFVNPGDTADKFTIFCQGIFDVTNTTNDKVKFGTGLTNGLGGTLYGDTNVSETHFTFIRLGDT